MTKYELVLSDGRRKYCLCMALNKLSDLNANVKKYQLKYGAPIICLISKVLSEEENNVLLPARQELKLG